MAMKPVFASHRVIRPLESDPSVVGRVSAVLTQRWQFVVFLQQVVGMMTL